MSVIWINKAFNIEGFTVIVNKRIFNTIYAQIWLSSHDDRPTFNQILRIDKYLTEKYNIKILELSEVVYHTEKGQPVNLTNFL